MSKVARACWVAALAGGVLGFKADAAPRPTTLEQPLARPTIEVTPATVVALGAIGDEVSIEGAPDSASAVVLVNPYGEDCTLRFILNVGESLLLRASAEGGQEALCELGLASIVNSSTAQFVYSCVNQAWNTEPKCSSREPTETPLQ